MRTGRAASHVVAADDQRANVDGMIIRWWFDGGLMVEIGDHQF